MANSDAAGAQAESRRRPSAALKWAGLMLGFGLGGFFDGILLHQVLQWHHLLSGVEQAKLELRLLIVADGMFHALMYVITVAGLLLLWRSRQQARSDASRRLLITTLLGFGSWHVVDAVLSHWILGIHRVRMDVENPLLWDLLWLGVFGILPIGIALMIKKRDKPSPPETVIATLSILVPLAAILSALPPAGRDDVVVIFRPDITEQEALSAIMATGGRLLGTDQAGVLWSVDVSSARPLELYRYGALFVSNSPLPLGCLSWTRA